MQTERNNFYLLEEAKRSLKMADHMIYITYPLLKENRLLIKILEQIYLVMLNVVKAVLQHEYYFKRIELQNNAEANFSIFTSLSGRYKITPEQVQNIKSVLILMEKHRKSPTEFVRRDKFVILSDDMSAESITAEMIKHFINDAKDILRKTEIGVHLP